MAVALTDFEKEILLIYADCDMSISETARHTFYHRNSIKYFLDKIYDKHGLNPLKFYDLCELLDIIRNEPAEVS